MYTIRVSEKSLNYVTEFTRHSISMLACVIYHVEAGRILKISRREKEEKGNITKESDSVM